MKKLIFILFLLVIGSIWADGIETFNNFTLSTGNYSDGTEIGTSGIEWTYTLSRLADNSSTSNVTDPNKDLPALMLRNTSSTLISGIISGGISNINVEYFKAFTGGGDRQIKINILTDDGTNTFTNEAWTISSISFNNYDFHIINENNINVIGDFKIQIINLKTKQVAIDEIAWTSYEDQSLPVELSFFAVTQTDNNVAKINWISQTETELLGYNIYKNTENNITNSFKINNTPIYAHNLAIEQNYSFTDKDVEFDKDYYYWLEIVSYNDVKEFYEKNISIRIEKSDDGVIEYPKETFVSNACPNPFNPKTSIELNIRENETASVNIYNSKGQLVKSFNKFTAGSHNVEWFGKDNNNQEVSSGIYFFRVQTESINITKKITLMK